MKPRAGNIMWCSTTAGSERQSSAWSACHHDLDGPGGQVRGVLCCKIEGHPLDRCLRWWELLFTSVHKILTHNPCNSRLRRKSMTGTGLDYLSRLNPVFTIASMIWCAGSRRVSTLRNVALKVDKIKIISAPMDFTPIRNVTHPLNAFETKPRKWCPNHTNNFFISPLLRKRNNVYSTCSTHSLTLALMRSLAQRLPFGGGEFHPLPIS